MQCYYWQDNNNDASLTHMAPDSVSRAKQVLSTESCDDVEWHDQQAQEEVGDGQVEQQYDGGVVI